MYFVKNLLKIVMTINNNLCYVKLDTLAIIYI